MSKLADKKSIGITAAEYKVLAHSKKTFEALTNCQISWGAYLVAVVSGALATYAIQGMELSCPNCGKRAVIRYVRPSPEPEEGSSELSPFSSRGLPSRGKR